MRSSVVLASLLAVPLLVAPMHQKCEAQPAKAKAPLRGFNLFSPAQDIQIGQQSRGTAEKQMAMLGVANAERYVNQVVLKLKAFAPDATYPYAAKIMNGVDLNALSLPGGPLYLNRGMIEAARDEAQLASVIAHEMAHISLRHGTVNVSRAYVGKTGLGLLGGLVSPKGIAANDVMTAVGGMGLNAAFLKFSSDDESAADRVAADMMARAGYSPLAIADFFAVLREEAGRDPTKLEMYFGNHPPSIDRGTKIREWAPKLTVAKASDIGQFAQLRTWMATKQYAATHTGIWPAPVGTPNPPASKPAAPQRPVIAALPAPSARTTLFKQATGFYTLSFPDNWRAVQSPGAFAAAISPAEGVITLANGQRAMVYGMVINHYYPFEGESARWDASMVTHYAPFDQTKRPRAALEDATDDLIRVILGANPYLKVVAASTKAETINGARAYTTLMSGMSPLTGLEERVKVYTRMLPDDHVMYAVCVSPARDFAVVEATLSRIMQSLNVDEDAVHR